MQNPDPPQKFRRTCPTCSRTVEPGDKFCATCRTKIPVLLTCSKCGTQFTAPVKYCDLCGAPVILGEVPESYDSPEHSEEENTGPVEDITSEQDETEIPEPDTGELTEHSEEENTGPFEDIASEQDETEIPEPDTDELPEDNDEENNEEPHDEIPHHYNREIQEPDTDELLKQFGDEYGDDETLESFHTSKPPSPIKHEAKKPVRVPAEQGLSETVDEVLFLSPGKPKAPAKSRINKTGIIAGSIVLIIIIAAIYFIALPKLTESGGFSTHSNPAAAVVTTLPESTTVRTIQTPPPSRGLVPLPTQLVPSSQKLYFQVQKNPVTSKILVVFAGSAGEGSIKIAEIKVTHPDGSFATGIIQPLKGVNEITLDGSKETDRVEIIAQMSDGGSYRVYDELVPLMR
jgi:hypothetical protein